MSDLRATVGAARSFLFVPGDRPDRFARALASGADVVVLDLEDAVPPAAKQAARGHVVELLTSRAGAHPVVAVRVSDPHSADGMADLKALGPVGQPVVVMVAKADGPDALDLVRERLGPATLLLPLVETAQGILGATELGKNAAVVRLVLGHLDLCAELGLNPADEQLLAPARFALLTASVAAGLAPPVAGVCTDACRTAPVRRETRAAVRAGFTAKLCIHPDQVAVVHEALAPDPAQLAWARRVLTSTSEHGATVLDGQLVDRPVYLRARSIVARSSESMPNEGTTT